MPIRWVKPTNIATLPRRRRTTIHTLRNGTFPEPLRSTHAIAAMAYRNVAVKIPNECDSSGSRAIQSTSRGEYAVALNWTITNVSENTMPVRAIIPEAIEE